MRTRLTVMAVLLLLAAGAWAENDAKEIYVSKCAVCHGPDGAAKTTMGRKLKVVDVRALVDHRSAVEMTAVLEKGKSPGMRAYGKDFTKDQMKALVEYFRSLAKQ